MMLRRAGLIAAVAGLLAGCNQSPDGGRVVAKIETKIARTDIVPKQVGGVAGATPMGQRTAVISLLNKRNGLVRDLEMRPGDSARVGRAIVRLRACETTPPWEAPPETGAFVQLSVQEQRDDKWYRIFSGWLFRERPDRNIVQHPIYDVFVKSCTMTFPGGEAVARATPGTAAKSGPSAPQSPATKGGEGGTNSPAAPAPAESPEPPAKAE
jgi:hypothetical protein